METDRSAVGEPGGDGYGADGRRWQLEEEMAAAMADVTAEQKHTTSNSPVTANGKQQHSHTLTQAKLELFGDEEVPVPSSVISDRETPLLPTGTDAPSTEWQELVEPVSGRKYYYNSHTQVTQWEQPQSLLPLEAVHVASPNSSRMGGGNTTGAFPNNR